MVFHHNNSPFPDPHQERIFRSAKFPPKVSTEKQKKNHQIKIFEPQKLDQDIFSFLLRPQKNKRHFKLDFSCFCFDDWRWNEPGLALGLALGLGIEFELWLGSGLGSGLALALGYGLGFGSGLKALGLLDTIEIP